MLSSLSPRLDPRSRARAAATRGSGTVHGTNVHVDEPLCDHLHVRRLRRSLFLIGLVSAFAVCLLLSAAVAGGEEPRARAAAAGHYWAHPWGINQGGQDSRLLISRGDATSTRAEWLRRLKSLKPTATLPSFKCDVYWSGNLTGAAEGTFVGCSGPQAGVNAYSHDNRLVGVVQGGSGLGAVGALQADGETLLFSSSTGCKSVDSSGALTGCTSVFSGVWFVRLDCLDRSATIIAQRGVHTVGTAGNDVIVGGPGDDLIKGGGGDDLICGWRGEDIIAGGPGDDGIDGGGGGILNGGPGDDTLIGGEALFGGADDDTLIGGDGDDKLYGEDGYDYLFGKDGADILNGGDTNDHLYGGDGADVLIGGAGEDKLSGQGGEDLLNGGLDSDKLQGGPGDNLLLGGEGDDVITAKDGDDRLLGGKGRDELFGETGDDLLKGGPGTDGVHGGGGRDICYGELFYGCEFKYPG